MPDMRVLAHDGLRRSDTDHHQGSGEGRRGGQCRVLRGKEANNESEGCLLVMHLLSSEWMELYVRFFFPDAGGRGSPGKEWGSCFELLTSLIFLSTPK